MGSFVDLTGIKYARLLVLSRAVKSSGHHVKWRCRCDCGKIKIVAGSDLTTGNTKSCGCLRREVTANKSITHGHRIGRNTTPEYQSWVHAKERCNNNKHKRYKDYGGRGISMCKKWADDFESFLTDMGPRPKGTSLDRINNDGDYEPTNCRWATRKVQNNNKRRRKTI